MGRRTSDQKDLIDNLNLMLVGDPPFVYTGPCKFTHVRSNMGNWYDAGRLHGIHRTIIYDNKLYIIRVE